MANKDRQKKKKKKRYTAEEKTRAVMMLRECGSIAHTARACGVPRTTLKQWDAAYDNTPQPPDIQEIETEVVRRVTDAKREFLAVHYNRLSTAFGYAIAQVLIDMQAKPPSALAAATIAEKLANIIKLFSTAEEAGVPGAENLLEICIQKIKGAQ